MEETPRRRPRGRLGQAMIVAVAAILPAAGVLSWLAREGETSAGASQRDRTELPLAAIPRRANRADADAVAIPTTDPAASPAQDEPAADDASLRRRLLGKWKQYKHGNRLLTVLEDGTATIVAEPDGVWKYLFGERIRIDIAWKLENGRVKFETTGGEPKAKADLVAEHWGRSRDTEIVTLNDQRLALLEEGDDEPSEWTRAE